MKTYSIYRFYSKEGKAAKIQKTGLTLEQAQKWCNDPQTSSKTVKPRNTSKYEWFDGYKLEN